MRTSTNCPALIEMYQAVDGISNSRPEV